MIFKSYQRSRNLLRIVNAGDDAPSLFFRGEPFCQHINASWHEQLPRLPAADDRVRLSRTRLGPMHEAPVEVARVDQGNGSLFRLLAKERLGAEIHDAPRGYR